MANFTKTQVMFLLLCTSPLFVRGENFHLLVTMSASSLTGLPSVQIALEKVNSDPTLLPGHNLTYDFVDTRCDAIHGLGRVVDAMRSDNYTAFIGPSCSGVCRHVGRLAVYYNMPAFTGVCTDDEMLDKSQFTTLIRTYGSQYKLGGFFRTICDAFEWKRISIISSSRLMGMFADGIRVAAENANITVAAHIPCTETYESHEEALIEAAKVSRIIVFCTRPSWVRSLMVMAYKMGIVNQEYAFFAAASDGSRSMPQFTWKLGLNETEDAMAKEAYESLFLIFKYEPDTAEYRELIEEIRLRAAARSGIADPEDVSVHITAALTHDAVYLYAFSLNETLAENGSPYDGYTIARRLYGRTHLPGVLDMTMDDNGDMDSDYVLIDLRFPDDADYEVVKVGEYYGIRKQMEFIPGVDIHWPGGAEGPPLDTPPCGYEGELCQDHGISDILLAFIILTCLILAILVVVSTVLYRRFKLQKQITQMLWKIEPEEIIFETRPLHSVSSMISYPSTKGEPSEERGYTKIAVYKGARYAVRPIAAERIKLTQSIRVELNKLREVNHPNLVRFVGACIDRHNACYLTEYCAKGSLQDILANDSITLDWMFRYSMLFDIVKGLHFIHASFIKFHGNLKSSNCLVDSRFVVKVSDFGVREWYENVNLGGTAQSDYYNLFWRAPELLRDEILGRGTQKGDVYSFGIILHEIITRREPYELWLQEDVLPKDGPADVIKLTEQCWSDDPEERPDFTRIKAIVHGINTRSGNSANILDNLLNRMEQYATNLEGVVADRTRQLLEEKKKSENLLEQLLPRPVAEQLKRGNAVAAEAFDSVTIFFSDIVGFTALSAASTPMQVVALLNDLYSCFDAIIDNFDVYKVETIGDAYMVVSGLPIRNGNLHAREIARMALTLRKAVQTFEIRHRPNDRLKLRIGIHSGPVVSGVVGLKMPRYCLFGDTVNTASRMESNGEALKIHISEKTVDILKVMGGFQFEVRGIVTIKGKGEVTTYWLLEEIISSKSSRDIRSALWK